MTQLSTQNVQRNNDPLLSLVSGLFGRPAAAGFEAFERESDWLPATDVSSDANGYTFTFDVPGVSKNAIQVSLEDHVLTVTGERISEETTGEGTSLHRSERMYGRFTRSFKLPADADAESVNANYRDGVLVLRVAKQEAAKPRKIDIG